MGKQENKTWHWIVRSGLLVAACIVGCRSERVGMVLVYQVDCSAGGSMENVDTNGVVRVVEERLENRGRAAWVGTDKLRIELFGEPKGPELEALKLRASALGELEFRVLADARDPEVQTIIAQAQQLSLDKRRLVVNGEAAGEWIEAKEELLANQVEQASFVQRTNDGRVEFLVLLDSFNVGGRFLVAARKQRDEGGQPALHLTFNRDGGRRLQMLTNANLPDPAAPGRTRRLGIILYKRLLAAPMILARISDQVLISGVPEPELDAMLAIFNAGMLPCSVKLLREEQLAL